MKLCDIHGGQLNQLITIERLTRTSDGQGGYEEAWAADPASGLYASMKYLTGTERWEAKRVQPGDLIRCIIRYRDDGTGFPYYTAADRVMWRNREFAILSVQDIEFARQFLQLELMIGRAT